MHRQPDTGMKLPLPYITGWKFTARQHNPPPPTRVTPGSCLNDDVGYLEWKEMNPVERCLQHPPLEGSYGSFSLDLQIRGTLRAGDDHNDQVVVVDVLTEDSHLKGQSIVAKIYDPLYFYDDDGYVNSLACVDKHYTHEAGIYAALSDLQGSMIPRYYGSFSIDIPIDSSTMRSVRLILIELIPGLSMRDLDPSEFSREERQSIMKSLVDFETLLYTRDILWSDTHPRNVILADGRALFIDFGDALFGRAGLYSNDPEMESDCLPGVYISPLLRWHQAQRRTFEFDTWIDWDWQSWLETEYGNTEGSITQETRDKFLPSYLLEPVEKPRD